MDGHRFPGRGAGADREPRPRSIGGVGRVADAEPQPELGPRGDRQQIRFDASAERPSGEDVGALRSNRGPRRLGDTLCRRVPVGEEVERHPQIGAARLGAGGEGEHEAGQHREHGRSG